ncbi:hypothetical protein FO519_001503 [Halicephalobus sp. NKZ332]|nr:hypothetical protein FO519_001503 [Halicephalobus sp. NKZ332]
MKSEFTYWFVFFELIFASIMEVFVFFAFSYLLYDFIKKTFFNKGTSFDPSPAMAVYMAIEILTAFFITVFLLFLLQGWILEDTHYNGYILFYSGAVQTFTMTLRPVAVFTLGIDRCLCVLFSLEYNKNKRFLPVILSVILMGISVGLSLVPRIIEFAPKTPVTNCSAFGSFGCMTSPASDSLYITMRYVSSAVNMAMGGFLFSLLRIKVKERSSKSNRIVLYTLCITFTLDLSPHLVSGIFYAVSLISLE